ncbi:MAG: hypothetical protein ACRDE2_00560 [Chitinophagaceae bacterium]
MHKNKLWSKIILTISILIIPGISAYSQALLPHTTVYNKNGANYISWTSGYTGIKQIGVQRSQDSLFNYATIGFARDPDKKVNEFLDKKPPAGKVFYRLFVLFTNNSYFFTDPSSESLAFPQSVAMGVPRNNVQNGPNVFQPSIYVYTNSDGNVNISLANVKSHHYEIRFFDSNNNFLFDLRHIENPLLILDKSNFLRAGWYSYELYDNDKLIEKWRFYIGDSVDKKGAGK